MMLIFGGAYQGKLAYAKVRFGLTEDDVYRCNEDDAAMPKSKKAIYEIDKWIMALIKADMDSAEALRRFIDTNKDAVVICNDISCGVVPVDPTLRKWREAVGRAMAELSRNSDEVVRLFCGIPATFKQGS
jgi:adenosyl cobinamide kinase/adenosyl cobinamide phosphate guanylyltransferase